VIGLFMSFLLISIVVGFAVAQPVERQSVDVVPSKGRAIVTIPVNAIEVAPGIFSLGEREHEGKIVEGFAFVDYKKEYSHRPGHNKGGVSCFSFLSRGAKWKVREGWLVNPVNNRGLNDGFIFNNLVLDIQKWEDAAFKDIMGDGGLTSDLLIADTSSPDGKNEIYIGDISDPGAIAVTIVWGIFSGPPGGRELVEWDQVYDEVDFDWSSSGETGKMDFENIATHEIGHGVGMGHPSDECTEETMYRFASFGETKKRDLNAGDIAGVRELYR